MKKLILAVGMLVASGLALAQSVTVNYGVQQNTAGAQAQGHYVQLVVATPIVDHLTNDAGINAFQLDVNKHEFDRLEDGLTYAYPINDTFTASIRGALGYMETSNNGNWGYYVIQPTITANLTHGFDASLGYRWREAFVSSFNDDSTTIRYTFGYHITDKDYIRVSYDDLRGSNGGGYANPSNTYQIGYTRNF